MDDVTTTDDPLGGVNVVLPRGGTMAAVLAARPLLPFAPPVLGFVEEFGRALRSDPTVRRYPELVALGFWARAANIARLRARFDAAYPEALRLPRGSAFHIAPSNVDTIFVYSLLLSMLAGNANIVRVSSRSGDQAGLLMQVFERVLAEADEPVRAATAIVRYEHDRAITDALSRAVGLRIVWGGDATVDLVRASPLAPTASELVFPNKFSLAVIDAEAWLAAADQEAVARAFVNDAYWFGQMACSSPRAVVWRGSAERVGKASAGFWTAIERAVSQGDFEWEDADAVAKLLAEQGAAMEGDVAILPSASNRVRVIRCARPAQLAVPSEAGNGFFREARVDALDELAALAQPHWQTIVSFGIDNQEWREALAEGLPRGIDRVVRVGTALDFDAIWDGKDLLAAMTRLAAISV
ncbi:hypothetical protein KRR38_18285 [Novosphingobium sp. G106]|uniref:acyl-CoA reductase n=1 Tax=Novosphingobium sp. G106 TaxID=2849500 RepID=UPI001C2CCA6E|nr:acyl-CoA reductase [Novosphingobium sp. G106]MBV1689576.1 hypothetical protein [Novosphingobium sp. G106]